MKERLAELIKTTETTYWSSERSVGVTDTAIKSDFEQKGWSSRKCPASSKPNISFGGQQPMPGGIDERAFFIAQKEWEKLPSNLKKILLNSKYRVKVY